MGEERGGGCDCLDVESATGNKSKGSASAPGTEESSVELCRPPAGVCGTLLWVIGGRPGPSFPFPHWLHTARLQFLVLKTCP